MKQKKIDKRICIYTLLFLFMMVIDQRTLTPSNYVRAAFVQASIIPFLFIIIMQMKLEKMCKWISFIYAICSIIIFGLGTIYLYNYVEFYLKFIVVLFEILIFGFIIIYAILNRKTYFQVKSLFHWEAILWIAMLFLMGISKYNGVWPWIVLTMLVLMINLNIDKVEQVRIFHGMLYGIMASYFLIQGYAFVFRPYDDIRYYGSYNNPNRNALFYTVIFVAYLINAYRLSEKKKKKWMQIVNTILTASIIGFSILTGCKTAILTIFTMLFLYALIKFFRKGEKIHKFILQSVIFILTIIFLLPICYLAARYIPPVFHHSVWFYEEYSVDKVHSFDAYNSEKYPEMGEVVNSIFGRYIIIEKVSQMDEKPVIDTGDTNTINEKPVIDTGDTNTINEKTTIIQTKPIDEDRSLEEILSGDDMTGLGTYTARLFIWKEYIKRFNLVGHVKISALAHNVFIEFAYYFGIIIGGIFLLGYGVSFLFQFFFAYKTRRFSDFGILSFITIFGVYGMAEVDWYPGQATLSLFFFMICFIAWRKNSDINLTQEGEEKLENKKS